MIEKHEPSQKWNPSYYASNARFVSELGSGILKKLSACKGEKILDLGLSLIHISEPTRPY